jgi:DNA-binding IclR family transcriptional regulator
MTASQSPQFDRDGIQRDPYLVKSVIRCSRVLRAFHTEEGGLGLPLGAIARRAGLPKSLVLRLLYTLRYIGWIEKRDRTYRLLVRVARQRREESTAAAAGSEFTTAAEASRVER